MTVDPLSFMAGVIVGATAAVAFDRAMAFLARVLRDAHGR